ncbi:MAG: TIR domain-containing protein [Deltaproteobacteria bacterium]|nr:TIR domain-containing protein [Deltaproteobacteria bacterium]
MARRTFFSFNYEKDVWRVNQIRNIPNVIGTSAAGFQDASLWEEAKKKGDAAIKKLIDAGLKNTSVTVVCITYGTAARKYINYEIDESLKRGNGLLGLQIHHLKDQNGNTASPGAIPSQITKAGFKAYKYTNKDRLAAWIEEAAELAGK